MLSRSPPSASGKASLWSCLVESQWVPASPARSGLRGTRAVKECSWQQAGSVRSDLTSWFPGQGQAAAHHVSAPAPRQAPSPNTTVLGGAVLEALGAACVTPSQGPAWASDQPGDPSSHWSCATALRVSLEARVLVTANLSPFPGLAPLCRSRARVGLTILAVWNFPLFLTNEKQTNKERHFSGPLIQLAS